MCQKITWESPAGTWHLFKVANVVSTLRAGWGALSSARWHFSNTNLSPLSTLCTDYFSRHYLPLGGIFQILTYLTWVTCVQNRITFQDIIFRYVAFFKYWLISLEYPVYRTGLLFKTLSSARWHSSNTDLSHLSTLCTDYFSKHYLPLGGIFSNTDLSHLSILCKDRITFQDVIFR